MNKLKKMSTRLLTLLLTAALLFSVLPSSIFAEGTETSADTNTGSALTQLDGQTPAGFNVNDTTNPLGTKQNQSYLMVEQNELALYFSDGKGSNNTDTVGIYNKLKLEDINTTFTGKSELSGDSGKRVDAQGMSYVHAVAFDPTGTGRNNRIAYVGVMKNTDGNINFYTWVQNAVTGETTKPQIVAGAVWMKKNEPAQFKSGNFIGITAGDYNGDGKDTYIVYTNGNKTDENDNPKNDWAEFQEFTYSESEGSGAQGLGSLTQPRQIRADEMEAGLIACNRETASITSADFDGDGIDELAISTASSNKDQGYKQDNTITNYTTNVSILKYSSNGFVSQMQNGYVPLYTQQKNGGTTTDTMLYSGSLAAGDIDGDGLSELVVAGYTGTVTVAENGELSNLFKLENEKIGVSIISNVGQQYVATNVQQLDANQFTIDGVYVKDDDVWSQLGVACVATNGKKTPEQIFINGTYYKLESGELTAITHSDKDPLEKYFSDKVPGNASNAYIESLAVGNFDHNSAGREQLFCSVAYKEKNAGNYKYKLMCVSGDYGTESPGEYTSTERYKLQVTDYLMKNFCGDAIGKGHTQSNLDSGSVGLNVVPVAIDNNNDGVNVRYMTKQYSYTDPQLEAVLEAPPYFGELGSYNDFNNGTTSYTIAKEYSIANTKETQTSIAVGFTSEAEVGSVKASMEAGYTYDYTKEFEESFTTTYSTTFTAGPHDTVVIQRTPITHYLYDVQNTDGSWTTDHKVEDETVKDETAKDETVEDETAEHKTGYGMRISVPGEPVYYQLSIDEYNAYVDDWNKQISQLKADAQNTANVAKSEVAKSKIERLGGEDKLDTLTSINNKKIAEAKTTETITIPGDTEGKPYNYYSAWTDVANAKNLSQSLYALSQNGGSITSQWGKSEGTTETITKTHGFHSSSTIMGGGKIGQIEIYAGYYADFDYSSGTGHSKSVVSSNEASGTVCGIDAADYQSMGYDINLIRQYGFNWQFGVWDRDLGTGDSASIPVYGYIVNSITKPGGPPQNLTAQAATSDRSSIDLSWSKPDNDADSANKLVEAKVDGYKLYRSENGGEMQLVTDQIAADALSYTDTGLQGAIIYTYYLKAVYKPNLITAPKYDSVQSNSPYALVLGESESAYDIAVRLNMFTPDPGKSDEKNQNAWIATLATSDDTQTCAYDQYNAASVAAGEQPLDKANWLAALKVDLSYESYKASVPQGKTPLSKEAWVNNLLGIKPETKTAYQMAVEKGYTENETIWNDSLRTAVGAFKASVDNGYSGTKEEWLTAILSGKTVDGVTAYQTARDMGYKDSVDNWLIALIGIPVESIQTDVTDVNLQPGQIQQITTTLTPENATQKTIGYSSDNPNVAIVDATGVITAVADGTTVIKVVSTDNPALTAIVNVTVKTPITDPSVSYKTHIQDIDWETTAKSNGATSGTTGSSKRLEAIIIDLDNVADKSELDVKYSVHVQDIGWMDYVNGGGTAGTTGQSKRLEGIKIELTGNQANNYNIYYRVHAQNIGWMNWASNGEPAGTEGFAYRLEAIQIDIVPKGDPAPTADPAGNSDNSFLKAYNLYALAHSSSVGWNQGTRKANQVESVMEIGTFGRQLEAIQLADNNSNINLNYSVHVSGIGWMSPTVEGWTAGTTGQRRAVEAFVLNGTTPDGITVQYRAYVHNRGWQDWKNLGEEAGTTGQSLAIELMQFRVISQ